MKKTIGFLLMGLFVFSVGCAQRYFIQTTEPGWNSVQIREGLSYDDAWDAVVDVLSKRFDLEMLDRNNGYIRTGWLYTWTGRMTESYKVRGIVKFNPERTVVEIRSEAQHYQMTLTGRQWVMGTDERLITTLRTDLMGRVGRVTR